MDFNLFALWQNGAATPPLAVGGLAIDGVDAALVVAYLLAVTAFGLWIGRGQRDAAAYFLGGRSLPGWAVLLSIVATETSTVTFLSIPGITWMTTAAENGDFRFLQLTFGYIVGRLGVVALLLPVYFRGQPFTAYEVLQQRFGVLSRRGASTLFLVTRTLSDGLRLFLTALVLQQVVGLDLSVCVIAVGVLTIIYTVFGGVRSVVWNDCIQFLVYMGGAVAALLVVIMALPGGVGQLGQFATEHDKWRLFDFDFSVVKPTMTFWSGLFGGMFLTAATHGADQLMVQRYLASRSQRAAGWALGLSGGVVLVQFALFLLIGVALACFYETFPPDSPFAATDKDRVFGHFIVNHLPIGLTGLTLAAVFSAAMSTLSSSLNSSATALVSDLVAPLTDIDQRAQLRVGRLATVAFGILQIGIAVAAGTLGVETSIVRQVLGIAGFATGPVLGLYLLGVLAQRVGQSAAMLGFLVGVAALTTLWATTEVNSIWYAAIGAVITFVAGCGFAVFKPRA